jgi:IS605 OrfB family transposase
MPIKTYNIKLQGREEFKTFWIKLLSDAKDAYNLCSDTIVSDKVHIGLTAIHNACYSKLRNTFPLLPSQAIIRVQKEVLQAFKSRKTNKHHGDTPHKHSLSMTLDKRLYSNFTSEGITLTSEKSNQRERFTFNPYPKIKELFATSVAKDPVIFFSGGILWLSIPFEVTGKMLQNDTSVGVDLGMKRFFVTSEGIAFTDKEYLRNRRKVRYLKRCVQSKRTMSSKRHFKKLSRREHNMSKNYCHKAVNVLLDSTSASYIVMEDLSKIKFKTSKSAKGFKKVRHNNALSQVPFYMFKQILTYKATLVGKQVVSVSPVNTSQNDCRDGNKSGHRKGCRYYAHDGLVFDADWNASVNIALRAKRPLSNEVLPIDGKLKFLSGRVQSTTRTLKA